VAGEGELTWIYESPPAPPRLSEPVLARFLSETGVRVLPKQAWTDVASLQAHGIPAVNYGPGDPELAHTPHEHVPLAAVAQCEERMRAWLR
jgi:succinyl-diaminopimelate desuccinylase